MSDVNQTTDAPPPAAPQQKRKYVRRAKAARPASAAAKPSSPFEGLTEASCCGACIPKDRKNGIKGHCFISGMSYCAHPYKGGLQSVSMTNHEAVKRLMEAKAILAHAKVDKKNR